MPYFTLVLAAVIALSFSAPLWSFSVEPSENDSMAQAVVTQRIVYGATINTLTARRTRDGAVLWTRRGVGLPLAANESVVVASTSLGFAVLTPSGRVRYRRSPCSESRPPAYVAVNDLTAAVLCRTTDPPYNLMKAHFFSLATGTDERVRDSLLYSPRLPAFGVLLEGDRYGVVSTVAGGASMSESLQALDLRSMSVVDTTSSEDQVIARARAATSGCARWKPVSGIQRYRVVVCGGYGFTLRVSVFDISH